jgi:hypothetical protein
MKVYPKIIFTFFLFYTLVSIAQYKSQLGQQEWVDSVFNSLSKDEELRN